MMDIRENHTIEEVEATPNSLEQPLGHG